MVPQTRIRSKISFKITILSYCQSNIRMFDSKAVKRVSCYFQEIKDILLPIE